MRRTLLHSIAGSTLLVILLAPALARASDYDKQTYFTFSGPVQVPGTALPAGTYRFTVVNPASGQQVVEVASENGKKVYALCQTLPDIHTGRPPDGPLVVFRETAAGVLPAIRSWFFPGEGTGYQFVYSRRQTREMAGNVQQPTKGLIAGTR